MKMKDEEEKREEEKRGKKAKRDDQKNQKRNQTAKQPNSQTGGDSDTLKEQPRTTRLPARPPAGLALHPDQHASITPRACCSWLASGGRPFLLGGGCVGRQPDHLKHLELDVEQCPPGSSRKRGPSMYVCDTR